MDEICPGRLDDRIAVVTGSTHGIGLGIARRFAREGASVVVNDHGRYDGAAAAEAVREAGNGAEVIYVEADVGEPSDVRRLVEKTVDAFDRIDVLVNNVGEGRNDHPAELSLEDWSYVMETTLRSGWLCVKHALEHMREGASVVNVSSVHGHATTPGFFPYNVAKAGVNGLTRALAVELADLGVRVNAISPGAIVVDEQRPPTDELRQSPRTDPIGRMGSPEDVAGLAAYLASEDAAYITGTVLPADGGRLAVQQTTPDNR